MIRKRQFLPAAVFILLLATSLRFHLLEAQSFWNDEGNSARLSERSLPAIIEGTASDIHPPLYYLILRGWRELAGETEFGLRSFSAYAGILTVAVVMALVVQGSRGARVKKSHRDGGDPRLGWEDGDPLRPPAPPPLYSSLAIAGLLAAVSPVLVYYSQETRMYALLALLATLSAWVLLIWLGGGHGAVRPAGWALAYSLLLAAGLYTQYFFPAVIAAQGVLVALWWLSPRWVTPGRQWDRAARRHRFWVWVGLVGLAAILYGPWIPTFLRQIGGRAGAPAGLASFAGASGRWLVLGDTMATGEATWAIFAGFALAILGLVAGRRQSAAPLILAIIPLIAMFFAGATDPAFFKFMLVVVPFMAVLMGMAWTSEQRARNPVMQGLRLAITAALTVAVLAGSLVSLGNLYTDPAFARADYRGMAARIAAEAQPNAGIILNAPNQWEAFTYYHRAGAPVYPLPRGRPDPAILLPELERISASHDRLYALYWGDAQRDPNHVVEGWLDANTFKASEEWVGDVRFVIYSVPRASTTGAVSSGAQFTALDGETITVEEFTVWPLEARSGDVIQIGLVWTASATPTRPYKVFLHLLDESGIPVAQRDSEPAGGSRPTTTWKAGETIADNQGLLLPTDLPPGEYDLRLGLYDAFDPSVRLPVGDGDSLHLQTIQVPKRD